MPTPSGPLPKLVIFGGTVINGRGGVTPNALVEILLDGTIGYVGPASGYTLQPGSPALDAAGGFILPGFMNAHVHNTEFASERRPFLLDGVTSTCNTGHTQADLGLFPDPYGSGNAGLGRAFNSGPFIVAQPDGYPSTVFGSHLVIQVADEAGAVSAANQLASGGADYIKIALEPDWDGSGGPPFPLLTPSEISAIAAAASGNGLILKAHVTDGDQVSVAIANGVRSFEHIPEFPDVDIESASSLAFIFSGGSEIAGLSDMRATLDQMAAANVVMVPTLTMMDLAVPWTRSLDSGGSISVYEEVVKYYFQVGGAVALGTDYPLAPEEHGMPMQELRAMLRALGSEMAVITASTYNAAFSCGQESMIGSLETGKMGDVIIVNDDPLANINALSNVSHVVLGGDLAN